MRYAAAPQRKAVSEVVGRGQRRLARLTDEEARALLPLMHQAEDELRQQLRKWIETRPGGELRWTAHKYRNAIQQLHQQSADLEQMLLERLESGLPRVQRAAVLQAATEVERLSAVFGDPVSVPLDVAKVIATTRSYIIPRIRSSAHRYAWGRGRASVAADMQRMLAVDVLKGAPVYETVNRLVRHGGPRGLVALKGVAGEKGAVVELIPEGLFARYRHWADRVVRTELSSAYGATGHEAMRQAAEVVPDLKRMWFADASACSLICGPMAGQIVGLHEEFTGPGGSCMYPPVHPHCGCTAVPWREGWPQL